MKSEGHTSLNISITEEEVAFFPHLNRKQKKKITYILTHLETIDYKKHYTKSLRIILQEIRNGSILRKDVFLSFRYECSSYLKDLTA